MLHRRSWMIATLIALGLATAGTAFGLATGGDEPKAAARVEVEARDQGRGRASPAPAGRDARSPIAPGMGLRRTGRRWRTIENNSITILFMNQLFRNSVMSQKNSLRPCFPEHSILASRREHSD